MFEKSRECADASWSPDHSTVQGHRQKLWGCLAFGVQPVKGVTHVGKPVVSLRESLAAAEASVVRIEGVANNEVSPVANGYPVGKVVVDCVAVVEKAAVC